MQRRVSPPWAPLSERRRRTPGRRAERRLARPLVSALASGLLGACQASLDLGDYEFARAGGTGGRGGSSARPLSPGGAGASTDDGGAPPSAQSGAGGGGSTGEWASACELPHARAAQADGGCVIGECVGPWRDQNGLAADGCEQGDLPAAGLALWFMADRGVVLQPDGSVSAWIDQSPNGFAATQALLERRPSLVPGAGDLPLLSFDGVDDYLDLPPGFASFDGSSFFAVVEAEPNDFCAGILHFSNGADANDVEFGRHRTNLLIYEVQGDDVESTPEAFVVGRRLVVSSVQSGETGNAELRIDGVADGAEVMALPADVERRTNYVGRNAYDAQPELCSMYFHGRIGELVFYPRGLSAGERARVEAYLHEKWQQE